jgi:succinoglycan biosynthesis protein ExoO
MPPVVSVIVSAQNESAFIQKSINSVLTQTMDNLELIVVDDASTDGTAEIVSSVDDSRVRLLRNDRPRHISWSRNRAIDVARGAWIAILDADDWFLPPRLEKLLSLAEKRETDLIADDIYFVPNDTSVDLERGLQANPRGYARPLRRLFRDTHLPHWLTIKDVLRGRLPGGNDPRISLVKPLIRRSFLNANGLRYLEVTRGEQDVPFYLDCLGHGARFLLVEGPWYCYRTHPNMTSKNWTIDDYQRRLRANQQLQTRSYVEASPELRHLFQQRHETLTHELNDHLFEKRLRERSGFARLRTMMEAPRSALRYLKNRCSETLGHRRAQLRNLPSRLRELVGWGQSLPTATES